MSHSIKNILIGTQDIFEKVPDKETFYKLDNPQVFVDIQDDGDTIYIVATDEDRKHFIGEKGEETNEEFPAE